MHIGSPLILFCRLLQVLNSGVIPGNRNADNIDEKLHDFNYLLFLSRTIQTTGVRAALLKSFGFGQVGGEVLLVHPHYLLHALPEALFNNYKSLRERRQAKTFRYLHDALIGVAPLVRVKTEAPYGADIESQVYLNPAARAEYDDAKGSWTYKLASVERAKAKALNDPTPGSLNALLQETVAKAGPVKGIGVDVQLIGEVSTSPEFLERNFTPAEREYCNQQPDPRASFAGRWAAKEAVVKALCNAADGSKPTWLEGAGGALNKVEIVKEPSGAPKVVIHIEHGGIKEVKVSISHSGAYATAIAVVVE